MFLPVVGGPSWAWMHWVGELDELEIRLHICKNLVDLQVVVLI